eukprot:CAMPEP_0180634838 /NCGR_PEP_ID=MMETSP1037_2-20121125/42336_1 /TAXON_ID=632150 /ORGANISM="Azadinium spinosum, Strain 3D9" /LENGTH=77 /DNA_ID=CAMNT_0022655989 /DNA_START=148 /DNA_END=377 /DNA_ORIENTATION=-
MPLNRDVKTMPLIGQFACKIFEHLKILRGVNQVGHEPRGTADGRDALHPTFYRIYAGLFASLSTRNSHEANEQACIA